MSLEVTVKSKLFIKKAMPLEVILGDDLSFGCFEYDNLIPEVLGDGEFIAFNPQNIGRGFSVVWNPNEKNEIALRMLQPSTDKECEDFYACVKRIAEYWNGVLEVDGSKTNLSEFLSGLEDTKVFNRKNLSFFVSRVALSQSGMTIYAAKYPLVFGPEDAKRFAENYTAFESWLGEKQAVDAYYNSPVIGQEDDGSLFGAVSVVNGENYIFPEKAKVPFGVIDPSSGKAVETQDFRALIGIDGTDTPLGVLKYDEFLNRLPKHKVSKFDYECILVESLTEDEIREIVN